MSVAPTLNAKYLRSFYIGPTGIDEGACMSAIFRLVYEFWGFCVRGTNDLVKPGGFATSQATGSYLNMPVGWESGSTVLLSSGSFGNTTTAQPYFTVTGSTSGSCFSPQMVGKWLTMWQSGSTSTDDSIYLITKWFNSSSIALDPTYGGTSIGPKGSVPQFTARSNINWRVVDHIAAAHLGWSVGQYMVMQFDDAGDINVSQSLSQAQIGVGLGGFTDRTALTITLSPSGSWDGTHFLRESYSAIDSENNAGPGSGGWVASNWFHNSGGGTGWVTIIAGRGFVICQAGGTFTGFAGFGDSFHIEIPHRLYPQASDPNPICANNFGNLGVFTGAQPGYGYAHFRFPSPYDTVTRRWPVLINCQQGAYWSSSGTQEGIDTRRWPFMYFNPRQSKFMLPRGILSLPTINGQASVTGQFSLARALVRSVRYIPGGYPYYMRVGDDNDRWIHTGGGVMWPWDNAIQTKRFMFAGF